MTHLWQKFYLFFSLHKSRFLTSSGSPWAQKSINNDPISYTGFHLVCVWLDVILQILSCQPHHTTVLHSSTSFSSCEACITHPVFLIVACFEWDFKAHFWPPFNLSPAALPPDSFLHLAFQADNRPLQTTQPWLISDWSFYICSISTHHIKAFH